MATDIQDRCGTEGRFFSAADLQWSMLGNRAYECRVLVCPEADGGFSAHALRLPGVVSQGETIDEAKTNIVEAFEATIQCYLEGGGTVPWQDVDVPRTKACQEFWILVNV